MVRKRQSRLRPPWPWWGNSLGRSTDIARRVESHHGVSSHPRGAGTHEGAILELEQRPNWVWTGIVPNHVQSYAASRGGGQVILGVRCNIGGATGVRFERAIMEVLHLPANQCTRIGVGDDHWQPANVPRLWRRLDAREVVGVARSCRVDCAVGV